MRLLKREGDDLSEWVVVGLAVCSLMFFLLTIVPLFLSVPVGGIGDGFPVPDGPAGYLVEMAGVTGSLAVSLALAAIYLSQNRILHEQAETMREQAETTRQQRETMREQAETMREQAETMRERDRPILAPTKEVSVHPQEPIMDRSDLNVDGFGVDKSSNEVPWVAVPIENHGGDVAHRLQLVSLAFTDGETDDGPFSGRSRVDIMNTPTDPISGGVVQPDDDEFLLKTVPQFSRGSDLDSPFVPFCRRIERLLREADSPVRFGFVLVYTDSVRERFYLPLDTAYSIAPDDYDDLDRETLTPEELVEITAPYDIGDLIKQTNWHSDDRFARQ